MVLFINNEQQQQSIEIPEALESLKNGLKQFAMGDGIRRPRIDNLIPSKREDEFFCFSSMEGGFRYPGYYALRIKPDMISWPLLNGVRRRVTYASRPGQYGGLVFLFDTNTAELLAIMNDGYIQHLRVATTAALGTLALSRADSSVLGILGSGGMARFFAELISSVRDIERIKLYSPTREHAEAFKEKVSERIEQRITLVGSPMEVTKGADIISSCTSSMQPVLKSEWIVSGVHITNVSPGEIGEEVNEKITTVGLFARRQPMLARGFRDDDFTFPVEVMGYVAGKPEERAKVPSVGAFSRKSIDNPYPNAKLVDCFDWRTGEPYRRESDQEISILASNNYGVLEGDSGPSCGMQGIQFASIGGRIYENALKRNLGTTMPLEMFLQDLPT